MQSARMCVLLYTGMKRGTMKWRRESKFVLYLTRQMIHTHAARQQSEFFFPPQQDKRKGKVHSFATFYTHYSSRVPE